MKSRAVRRVIVGAIGAATSVLAFFRARKAYRWWTRTIRERRKRIEEGRNPVKLVVSKEWKAVPGWRFSVTRDGFVQGPSGKTMTPQPTKAGHLYVMSKEPATTPGGRRKTRKLYVHRAVLLAFVGPCPEGQECRHLNGKPADNRVENLAWGTRTEQQEDDRRNGVYRQRSETLHRLTREEAEAIRSSKTSARVAAIQYGVSHTTILKVRRGVSYGEVRD